MPLGAAAAVVQRVLGRMGLVRAAARRRARRLRDDPVERLGYLQAIAFRACRLVVDTGIHAKRWTREQGVRFFVDVNGSNPVEVASEVDRYCAWPGQACGYKVGHTQINRERERAKAALGARFDLKAFDDTVVLGGNVPLDVLAKNVDEYIKIRQGLGALSPARCAPMIIGLISDTHGLFRPEIARAFAGVDRILHAGDVGSHAVLEALAKIAPVEAVFGNVDDPHDPALARATDADPQRHRHPCLAWARTRPADRVPRVGAVRRRCGGLRAHASSRHPARARRTAGSQPGCRRSKAVRRDPKRRTPDPE